MCFIKHLGTTTERILFELLPVSVRREMAVNDRWPDELEVCLTIYQLGNYQLLLPLRNSSCGKVMFSQASVILSTGGRCTPPKADTPPWLTSSGQTPPPQTATAADGTHPTGMHSC